MNISNLEEAKKLADELATLEIASEHIKRNMCSHLLIHDSINDVSFSILDKPFRNAIVSAIDERVKTIKERIKEL